MLTPIAWFAFIGFISFITKVDQFNTKRVE